MDRVACSPAAALDRARALDDAASAELGRRYRLLAFAPLDPAERDRLRTFPDRLVAGTRSPEGAR